MPISGSQKSKLAQQSSENAEAKKTASSPSDTTYSTEEAKDSDWLSLLSNVSGHHDKVVGVHTNLSTYDVPATTMSKRLLSSEGFPPTSKVYYTFASPNSFTPWSKDTAREVKQIVLHSFGQQWHAFKASGKWKGAMNASGGRDHFTQQITESYIIQACIPKGTIPENGMYNAKRLSSSLQYFLNPPDRKEGVHFVISRNGDLYVLGDTNNIYGSAGSLSESCVSIALEEALYLDVDLSSFDVVPATWLPGGNPLGTEGNLKYWDYSPMQYVTLATLIAKLRIAYPDLNSQTYSSSVRSVSSSFTGITMRSHISGTSSDIVDVSPHFQNTEAWVALYSLIDAQQSSVALFNVWKPNDESYASYMDWAEEAANAIGPDAMSLSKQMTNNPAVAVITGAYRSNLEAKQDSSAYRYQAAIRNSQDSSLQSARAGVGRVLEQAANAKPATPKIIPLDTKGA
jgi:hypothetical protein